METVILDGRDIHYSVTRKRNKNLYARMDKDGVIIVTCPYLVSKRTIEKFVIESYPKLKKKIEKHKKEVSNNGIVNILGVSYNVDEIEDLNYTLTVKLKEFVKERYLKICESMNVTNIPVIRFKRVKGYLGEYNKKNNVINLNILIGHLNRECVEYVIIHELCHIKYMNHQECFWKEVSKHCPNYLLLRKKCKKEFVYYENY